MCVIPSVCTLPDGAGLGIELNASVFARARPVGGMDSDILDSLILPRKRNSKAGNARRRRRNRAIRIYDTGVNIYSHRYLCRGGGVYVYVKGEEK